MLDRCHWSSITSAYQAYRHASIVMTLAIELGITQRPMSLTQHEMLVGSGSSVLSQPNESLSSKFWGYEARRAFVGAYAISSL